MKAIYFSFFVLFFSCSNEDITYSVTCKSGVVIDQIKVLKQDPSIEYLRDGMEHFILETMRSGKVEIEKSGRIGQYSELKDIVEVMKKDTVSITESIGEIGYSIVGSHISSFWDSMVLHQTFQIDLSTKSIRSNCERYSFYQENYKGQKHSDFQLINKGDFKNLSSLTDILNTPKYIWIGRIKSIIEVNDLNFTKGDRSQFLKNTMSLLKKKQLAIYRSEEKYRFDELNIENFLLPRIDTIITFDPETYDENMFVRKYKPLDLENIQSVEAIQLLCFNKETSSFDVFPLGLTLIEENNAGFREKLFTIR